MAGLKAARAEGRTGGNRRKMTPQQIEAARKRITEGLTARKSLRYTASAKGRYGTI